MREASARLTDPSLWQVSNDRVYRRRARRLDVGTLEDLAPGAVALHALLPWEQAAMLDIVERWGTVDRSHRKLASPEGPAGSTMPPR